MVDLRPKLADEFIDGILDDLRDRGGLGDEWNECDSGIQAEIRASWKALILERFVSHSIPITDGHTCTYDPEACVAFLAKYPKLQEFIDVVMAEDAWLEWQCSDDSLYQAKVEELDDVGYLLMVNLRWKQVLESGEE